MIFVRFEMKDLTMDDVLAICKVVQRTLFINNPNSSFLSANSDTLDVFSGLAKVFEFSVNYVGCLDGCLRVEFRGERDFEKDVLHNVRPIRDLELKWFTLRRILRLSEASLRWTYLE
jgi:hypothetical protein